ncbi:helix-turn-helix domain-containing protein [Kribbella sp. NPDC050820]|uniref:helix-turn-helix domain-containing protein n=1 Tax=Kribbella sp. NPDC050820 TaxID=3155408 RepID=UPI00340C85B6
MVGQPLERRAGFDAQQMGTNITRFRNEHRFRRFLDTYGAGHDVTVLDAALEAGFGSYPQFHRVTRSITGTSPAEYLKARSSIVAVTFGRRSR